ncbi:MAG: DUF1127 domain-containing protein [Alphaproteobacteria bacterium]|nr:DUF1127 domain-containing protein [Alphaproteobacteria bacterium]
MVAIVNDILRNSQLARRQYRRAGVHELSLLAAQGVQAAVRLLTLWRRRAIEKRELASLDERGLHDIGLTRSDVQAAIAKPFWRA